LKPAKGPTRHIAAVHTGNDDWEGIEPDMNVAERFYKGEEWAKLTKAQKKGVMAKRKKRKNGQQSKGSKSKTKQFNKKIAALERKVAALTVTEEDTSDDSSVEEQKRKKAKTKKSNNRRNPATSGRSGNDSE